MNIKDELNWRNLLKQVSNEQKLLEAQQDHRGVYCGFDPTADSLHIGHLIPLTLLERFRLAGFQPIALIGGGTGMIGDPSFKSQERVLQSSEQVLQNSLMIEKQICNLLPKVQIRNNKTWLEKLSLIDFLRDVGKNFNLAYLLSKDIIASRIQSGLSITEFLYTILQAYDFYTLYQTANCFVQIGGSDQWGNITSGLDLISSQVGKDNSRACGLTIQLLTKKDGKKFGKTESGTIWLDANKTSEYEFYQFWFNQEDKDVVDLLKIFTFLTLEEINDLVSAGAKRPQDRILQKKLAEEVTLFVHQAPGLAKAQRLSEAFFTGQLADLTPDLLAIALQSLPQSVISREASVVEAIVQSGAASSKREARSFLEQNAITFNDQEVRVDRSLASFKLIDGQYLLVKRGKQKYFLLVVQ